MNVLDIGILLIFISFLAIGSKNGVIREAVNFVGMILVFIISYSVKGIVGHYLCIYFPFLPLKGALEGLTTFNIFIYEIIAFIVTFGILLGIYAIIVKGSELLQKLLNMTIILIIPSKILGAIISGIKCWVLMFVVLLAVSIPLGSKEIFQDSTLANTIIYKTPFLSNYTSSFTSSLKEVYQVVENISEKDKDKTTENLKCLDIMLKYKMVNKNTVEELLESKKLEKIEGMEEILNKY